MSGVNMSQNKSTQYHFIIWHIFSWKLHEDEGNYRVRMPTLMGRIYQKKLVDVVEIHSII